jgi:hypothetical protein
VDCTDWIIGLQTTTEGECRDYILSLFFGGTSGWNENEGSLGKLVHTGITSHHGKHQAVSVRLGAMSSEQQ